MPCAEQCSSSWCWWGTPVSQHSSFTGHSEQELPQPGVVLACRPQPQGQDPSPNLAQASSAVQGYWPLALARRSWVWLVLGEPWVAVQQWLVHAGYTELVHHYLLQPFQGSRGGKKRVKGMWVCVCVCTCGCRTKCGNRGEAHAMCVRMGAWEGKITSPQHRIPLPVFLIKQHEDVSAKAASFHSSCIMKLPLFNKSICLLFNKQGFPPLYMCEVWPFHRKKHS